MMNYYRLTFTVDGRRTEQVVRAYSLNEAKAIIKSQYQGCRINFISTGHEYM